MKNKKLVFGIIGVVAVIIITLATTYAYWIITRNQESQNALLSACLDISLTNEANDISLTDQFPLSDEDGLKLTPYTFTVSNNCNQEIKYYVILESIGDEQTAISRDAIKVAINESTETKTTPFILSTGTESDTTITDAYIANKLISGTLAGKGSAGASKTYNLRLWIDENASINEMKKTYTSKISVSVGQVVFNPYEQGTLAYNIVSKYGGADEIKNHRVYISETTGSETYYSMTATTNYYWGTEISLDETTGKYTLDGILNQATVAECRAGQLSDGTTISCGTYTLKNASSEASDSTVYKVMSFTNDEKEDTASTNYITVQSIKSNTVAGLYQTPDDDGQSFYFNGNVNDNYVKFGEWAADSYIVTGQDTDAGYTHVFDTLEKCTGNSYYHNCEQTQIAKAGESMFWRIIRTNGDGTIRMIYDGTDLFENGTSHSAFVGFDIYDKLNSVLNNWYSNNIEEIFGSEVAKTSFCKDTSYKSSGESYSDDYGYSEGYREYSYYSVSRISNNVPQLTCEVDNSISLVGTLSADEALLAGPNYLLSNSSWWTLTPYRYRYEWKMNGDRSDVYSQYAVNSAGKLYSALSYEQILSSAERYGMLYIRPVINLKADVKFTGDGTMDSPYEIVTE